MRRRGARQFTRVIAVSALATSGVLAVGAAPASAAPTNVPFSYIAPTDETPDPFQTWQVPAGVTQITVVAEGAAGGPGRTGEGGGAAGGPGGPGARVTASIAVTPLETLQIRVGGAGAIVFGGYNGGGNGGLAEASVPDGPPSTSHGGGGGGATDVRRTPYASADRLVTAGGGGGGGADDGGVPGDGGAGGSGGQTGGTGGGGLCAIGGAPGVNADGIGSAGGGGGFDGGGGGGGGAAGGGGGGSCASSSQAGGGGGGGGSSVVVGPTGTPQFEDGVVTGNGSLTITYEASAASPPGAPSIVGITPSASQSALVRFSPPADTGSGPITGYEAMCGGITQAGVGSPITVTGLTDGAPTTCKVRAENDLGGFGDFSAEVGFTAGVPLGPLNGKAVPGPIRGSVSVTWGPAQDNGSAVTNYFVTCRPNNPVFPTRSASLPGSKRAVQLNNLTVGQNHSCSITATNGNGVGNPQVIQPNAQVKPRS
jgi:hypothetical protein